MTETKLKEYFNLLKKIKKKAPAFEINIEHLEEICTHLVNNEMDVNLTAQSFNLLHVKVEEPTEELSFFNH